MSAQPSEPIALAVPEALLDALARRVAELVGERLVPADLPASPWLDFKGACAYLGFSADKLYKLTAAKAIPFRKKRDGQGLLFHRAELDRWLDEQYPQEGWLP